jgi:hypothetical protein
MPDIFCTCLYTTFVGKSVSNLSTVLEFLFSAIIAVSGITLNCEFLKKLREEKKKTPLNRKGNVIEPIMRWFCVVQIIYWPYHLLFFWIMFNEIIPSEQMNGWWCNATMQIAVKFGRMIVSYNSLFIAIIRYIYIVHHQKSNQWEFEKVGRFFQIASIAVPIAMESVGVLTNYTPVDPEYTTQRTFTECIDFYQGLNSTNGINISKPSSVEWTLNYVPESVVLGIYYAYNFITAVVFLNLIEGFCYIRIHQTISR